VNRSLEFGAITFGYEAFAFQRTPMRKQYLHLSAFPCDMCAGPVLSGSVAVRENEISKETDIRPVGAICLSCGHRQNKVTEPARACHFPPIAWEPVGAIDPRHLTAAFVEALNRATETIKPVIQLPE